MHQQILLHSALLDRLPEYRKDAGEDSVRGRNWLRISSFNLTRTHATSQDADVDVIIIFS